MRSVSSSAFLPASGMHSQAADWGPPLIRRGLLLAWLLACAPLHAQSDSVSRAQADAYLDQARAAGRAEAAPALIEAALSLAPGYSEALYLRALSRIRERAMSRSVREDLRRAAAAGDWQRTDPDEAALALAEVLVRTAALAEAEPILRRLVRERPENPRALLALAALYAKRAAGETGPEARRGALTREQAVLGEGILRFPRHEEFPLRMSRSLEHSGRIPPARAMIASALKELTDSLPLLLRAAELEPRADARLKAVDAYLARSGGDPLAAVLALEAKPKDPARYLSRFVSLGGLSRVDITERAWRQTASSKTLSTALRQELVRFSGSRDLDKDGDGFWEERWEIAAGIPVSWTRDVDQDGAPELLARFRDGQPVSIDRDAGAGGSFTFIYSRYPSLHSVAEAAAGGLTRTSILAPYSLNAPFLEKPKAASPALDAMVAHTLSTISFPARAQLAGSTWRTEERRAGSEAPVRRIDSSKGLPSFMEEDLDGDGRIDHRVWYQNGFPVRGERDLAGDGIFEARETWRDGVLLKSAFDTDGNGKADYLEISGRTVIRLWDYDEDGTDDSRQSVSADGSIVREFCTRLDGVFDLRVIFRAGRIVSVERGGMPVTVRTDAAGGVVWIGRPALSAAPGPDTPEGFHSAGGRRYLVFRHDGVMYAEELK